MAYMDNMDLGVCCPRKVVKLNHSLTHTSWIMADTTKRTLADKRGGGPAKLLCTNMFDISKICPRSGKSPKVFAVSVMVIRVNRVAI